MQEPVVPIVHSALSSPWWYGAGFGVAALLGLYFTPVLRQAALRFGIVDHPDGKLKNHEQPVAYMGGVAIYIAFLLSLGLMPLDFKQHTLGLLLGASVVLLLGLIDDLKALTPGVKFAGQLLAAFVLIKADIRIDLAFLPDFGNDLCTVIWVVGVTNAFNILDVMDGLAAGAGICSLIGLFAVAVINGATGVDLEDVSSIALFIACLGGAMLGFLKSNFRPAKIYLGDAGSMLIGFCCGSLAMILKYDASTRLGVFAPLLLLGVPLFDMAFVMVLRWRQGIPVFRGSPDHFAVRLKRHGVDVGVIVLGAWICALLLALAGIVLTCLGDRAALWLLAGVVIALIVAGVALSRLGRAARPENAGTS